MLLECGNRRVAYDVESVLVSESGGTRYELHSYCVELHTMQDRDMSSQTLTNTSPTQLQKPFKKVIKLSR